LVKDFQKEWEKLQLDKKQLNKLSKWGTKEKIDAGDGVILLSYGALQGPGAAQRVGQLTEWASTKHEGLIIFDEAHMMKNAFAEQSAGRFGASVSQTAMNGLQLQWNMPQARVVYFSATAATEVANLAYAERLGLWDNAVFPSKGAFINDIAGKGISAMEVVAWNLKAMGRYIARAISFRGVKTERVEHTLNTAQVNAYNSFTEAFREVRRAAEESIRNNTGGGRDQLTKFRSQFYGKAQDFLSQTLVAMQLPSVLPQMKKDIEAGHGSDQRRRVRGR
jgi:hypothetical protein